MTTANDFTSYLDNLATPTVEQVNKARAAYLKDGSLRNLVNFAYENAADHELTGADFKNPSIFGAYVYYYRIATKWIAAHTTRHTADEILAAVDDSDKLAKIKADIDETKALEEAFAEWARAKKVFGFPIVAA